MSLRGLIIIFAIVIGVLASVFIKNHCASDLALNSKINSYLDKLGDAGRWIKTGLEKLKMDVNISHNKNLLEDARGSEKPAKGIELILKHGNVLKGKLLEEDRTNFSIEYQGQVFEIPKSSVKSFAYKTQKDMEWPYKHDVVVKKTNTLVLDGKITGVSDEAVTLLFTEGGGDLEMEINKKDIECLLFAPVCNKGDIEIEHRIKKQFPNMKMFKEGNVTIFTDSNDVNAKFFKKAVRDLQTELYYKLFRVFDKRSPKRQNFIIIFDNRMDYIEQTTAIGLPGFYALGFFYPPDNTTYLFNSFGDYMEKILYDYYVRGRGKLIDTQAKDIKDFYKSYGMDKDMEVDGEAREIKNKISHAFATYKGEAQRQTISVLRHELTHSLMHNWELQIVVMGKSKLDHDKITEKKKELTDTSDPAKQKEIIMEVLNMREKSESDMEILLADKWFVEGMATYCDTTPLGTVNNDRLYSYQDSKRQNRLRPVELLINIDNFKGMQFDDMLSIYGQGWALVYFLMEKYPEDFQAYLNRMADTKVSNDAIKINVLLECLKTDGATVEKAFREFMDSLPEAEDPTVKMRLKYMEIFDVI